MNPSHMLRKELETVIASNQARGADIDFSQYLEWEKTRKSLQSETENCQMQSNQLSKSVALGKKQGDDVSDLLQQLAQIAKNKKDLEHQLKELLAKMKQFELGIPNVLAKEVPLGNSEDDNQEISRWGSPRTFSFPVKSHIELAETDLDFARAAKISGARFVFMKGRIAKLHRALAQWMLEEQISRGYTEINPPLLVEKSALYGTGQLPKFADGQFFTEEQQHALIPTAEVSVTNLYREEIVEDTLPHSFVALTPCFRSEAGAYGKDTHGLIRLHQFEKVELVKFVREDQSDIEFEALLQDAEHILQALELPYRKMLLCSKDTGFSAKKTYDLEVWLPGENQYREISSCSHFGDFQARRMQARCRHEGKVALMHTLNGSGLAVGRALIAVMENHQTEDGKIRIPTVLKPYMDNQNEI